MHNTLISNYSELALRELREAGRRKPESPLKDIDLNYRSLEYYLEYATFSDGKLHVGMRRPWNCELNGLPKMGNVMRWIREESEKHVALGTGCVVVAAVLRDSKTDEMVTGGKYVPIAPTV